MLTPSLTLPSPLGAPLSPWALAGAGLCRPGPRGEPQRGGWQEPVAQQHAAADRHLRGVLTLRRAPRPSLYPGYAPRHGWGRGWSGGRGIARQLRHRTSSCSGSPPCRYGTRRGPARAAAQHGADDDGAAVAAGAPGAAGGERRCAKCTHPLRCGRCSRGTVPGRPFCPRPAAVYRHQGPRPCAGGGQPAAPVSHCAAVGSGPVHG